MKSTKTQMANPKDISSVIRSPLRHFDSDLINLKARREVRNREVHLPPISTYRWWARRTEAVNGSIIDAVNLDRPGRLAISDPFAGGGVIPLSAVIRGHAVYAQDLNPWATTGLAAMLSLPAPEALRGGIAALKQRIYPSAQAAYGTVMADGAPGVVSHTFRVAVAPCTMCKIEQRLYPHALVSLTRRVERGTSAAYLACPQGHLFKGRRDVVAECPECGSSTDPERIYTPRRVVSCPCGHQERLEDRASASGLSWEVVLVERAASGRREIEFPTAGEVAAAAAEHLQPLKRLGEIPEGQETAVLRRHGFRSWEDLYPRRQRAILEKLLALADSCSTDPRVVAALKLAVVGSAEMAGHLSRWDRFYLKSYESMAGHRFNFTTISVEPNVWGTETSGRGTTLRRLVQLVKAAEWLHSKTGGNLRVEGPIQATSQAVQPLIGTDIDGEPLDRPDVLVVTGSSQRQLLPTGSIDLVLTDPPYHDDVQYGELSRPFQEWAGLTPVTAISGDAVVNRAIGQLTKKGSYTALLTSIFAESSRLLRDDGHLIFSYANRDPRAWIDLIEALQNAGLQTAGCAIVHSENETDQAKRNVRSCTLDLLLDLIPVSVTQVDQHSPSSGGTPEEDFLEIVSSYVLSIGNLRGDWRNRFIGEVQTTEFLKPLIPREKS